MTEDKRPRDGDEPGAIKNARYAAEARKAIDEKEDPERLEPSVEVADEKVKTDAPEKKETKGYDHHADNDGQFHLKEMDDGTNVVAGELMENLTRAPAHQHHELDVEEDAPGYDQAAALMTPRGNPHYDEGGSVAEIAAGRAAGEA